MSGLRYTVIKSKKQYLEYCKKLEALQEKRSTTKAVTDEIELLAVLIEKWDKEHNNFYDLDPIELLLSLMKEHQLQAKDLVEYLGISKGYVSDILHYKKSLSKIVIRKLAERFKVSQEAFNRPYPLLVAPDPPRQNPISLKIAAKTKNTARD